MSFRDFINKYIIKLVNYKPKLLIFQIGCFPSSEENMNHEYPNIIETYKKNFPNLEISQILIDKVYRCKEYGINKCNNLILTEKYGNNVFTYPYYIDDNNYNTIVELCHFMSNFNTYSIIMEFTSIIRKPYFDKDNMTDYLYITPSKCLINTTNKLFNPILKYDNNNFSFFRPDMEDSLYQYVNKDISINEREFILADLERRKEKLLHYRIVLNYMRMDLKYNEKVIEKNYNKSFSHFYMIKNNIKYRLNGYDKESTNILIRDFERGEHENLEIFLYDLIFSILYDILVYLYKEEHLINENYHRILFSNDEELEKCINNFCN